MSIIVVSEVMDSAGLAILSTVGEVHYDKNLWRDPETLRKWAREADALVVRNQTQVTESLLRQAGCQLKVVGRLGVGLDNIDLVAARAQGIVVVSALGANAVAVAEYVFAAMLHFSRALPTVDQSVREGRWDRTLGGFELYGKTLGLVGLGDIGQRIAIRARAFGLHTIAYDPWRLPNHVAVMDMGVELVSLVDLFHSSDFISVHVPLTEKTRGLIGEMALRNMKPSAVLINTARGGIVDEEALSLAVRRGDIAGAALDVRPQEPPTPDDFLTQEPRILLTPHIAGLTAEASVRTAETVATDVVRVLNGQAPLAAV